MNAGDTLIAGGHFGWEIVGLDGQVRHRQRFHNGIPAAALTDLVEVYFTLGTQKGTWSLGLISGDNFDELASTDTMASHVGWEEFEDYSESARPSWTPGSVANGQISNPSAAAFTVTANGTIVGAFLASNSTKGGTTGFLWTTGLADVEQEVQVGETVRLYYELTAANG